MFFILQTEGNERENLRKLLQYANVICRIVNSTRKIDVDKFEKYCKAAYEHAITHFDYCNIAPSIHRIWAHCGEKMRKMGNVGLGQLSETPLESTHKVLRKLLKFHSRPFLRLGLIGELYKVFTM